MPGKEANNPGYRVTGDGAFHSNDLAFVVRRRCRGCDGSGEVPTPAWKAWNAEVASRAERRHQALGHSGTAQWATAKRESGEEPKPKLEECAGCEGRGWNEYEVTLRELARDLVDLLRVKGKRVMLRREQR